MSSALNRKSTFLSIDDILGHRTDDDTQSSKLSNRTAVCKTTPSYDVITASESRDRYSCSPVCNVHYLATACYQSECATMSSCGYHRESKVNSTVMNYSQCSHLSPMSLIVQRTHTSKSRLDRKPRQAYSTGQLDRLEAEFKMDRYLSVNKRMELAKTLQLSETQIKTWFQNRRTKWKKQMSLQYKMASHNSGVFALPHTGQPPLHWFQAF